MGLIDNIKAEAKGNRTIIQSSDAQALSKILNNIFWFFIRDIWVYAF